MKKRRNSSQLRPIDLEDGKISVRKLASSTRLVIRVIAGGLAVLFAFLSMGQNLISDTISAASSDIIYKFGLFLYYTSWVFGAQFDVDIEESVYVNDNLSGHIGTSALLLITVFSIASLVLLSLHVYGYRDVFPLGLAVFLLANYLGWLSICRRVQPIIDSSTIFYQNHDDTWSTAKLQIVRNYICGSWQRTRFISLALLIAMLATSTFVMPTLLASLGKSAPIWNGIDLEKLLAISPALFFLVYVFVAIGWMWLKRAETSVKIQVLDYLRREYSIQPLSK